MVILQTAAFISSVLDLYFHKYYNFFDQFAETSLAHELQLQGAPTLPFLYYLAVSHYKQLRYEDSLSHLEQALHLEWKVGI